MNINLCTNEKIKNEKLHINHITYFFSYVTERVH